MNISKGHNSKFKALFSFLQRHSILKTSYIHIFPSVQILQIKSNQIHKAGKGYLLIP